MSGLQAQWPKESKESVGLQVGISNAVPVEEIKIACGNFKVLCHNILSVFILR